MPCCPLSNCPCGDLKCKFNPVYLSYSTLVAGNSGISGKGPHAAVPSRAHREASPGAGLWNRGAGGRSARPHLLCLPAVGHLGISLHQGTWRRALRKQPSLPVDLQGSLGIGDCRRRGGWLMGIRPKSLGKNSHTIYSVLRPETMQKPHKYLP